MQLEGLERANLNGNRELQSLESGRLGTHIAVLIGTVPVALAASSGATRQQGNRCGELLVSVLCYGFDVASMKKKRWIRVRTGTMRTIAGASRGHPCERKQ